MRLPGFIDSHMHVLGLGYVYFNLDLTVARSIEDIKDIIRKSNNKKVIIGRGWNQEELTEKKMPTKNDLNSASSDIPVLIVRVCGHVIVVNDKMLELAGIDTETKQISGGEFSFKTGIFSEKAINLIYSKLPKATKQDLKKYLIKANQILLSNGVTSVASDDFSTLSVDYELVMETIKELYEEELLQVRITEQVNLKYDKLQDFINKGYVNKQFGKFKMGPLKILADGSLGGKTAFLLKPYENELDNFGTQTFSDEDLFKLVHLANSNKMDVVIHAIGDGAIEQALNILIKSIKLTKRYEHNHALIHAQMATNNQIDLMKAWGIGAIVQPIFLNTDIPIIESRIGSRYMESYLFKTMFDKGVNVGFSTDNPIEPVNPFYNIYTAISRKSIKFPELKPFIKEESFDIESALKCYTINNLKYVYQDVLPKGDYVTVDKDIHLCNIDEIKTIKIFETFIDNVKVFNRN
ncbi:amidohydrolase [Mycoplasmatota bacterium WC30]